MSRPADIVARVLRLPPTGKDAALEEVLYWTQIERDALKNDLAASEAAGGELVEALDAITTALGAPWDDAEPVEANVARALAAVERGR